MSEDTVRKEFEAWAHERNYNLNVPEGFLVLEAWQAAFAAGRSSMAQEAAQACLGWNGGQWFADAIRALAEKRESPMTTIQAGSPAQNKELTEKESSPDWSRKCEICGQSPIVPITGMCGPCTFGEAETDGGNW